MSVSDTDVTLNTHDYIQFCHFLNYFWLTCKCYVQCMYQCCIGDIPELRNMYDNPYRSVVVSIQFNLLGVT